MSNTWDRNHVNSKAVRLIVCAKCNLHVAVPCSTWCYIPPAADRNVEQTNKQTCYPAV